MFFIAGFPNSRNFVEIFALAKIKSPIFITDRTKYFYKNDVC